ncbi:eIF-2-alpha kinase GCN2-like [Plutella xylostella]|uniref:eIF-2-alpha kinase GCN2-like n=1 Tax=Plutella xylostella TaxID=51655 RepID=UPI00203288BB|nr:eIF-2-alpha kinase GCN2-like [Plutella xylostella]
MQLYNAIIQRNNAIINIETAIELLSLATVSSEALSPLLSHALSARGSRPYTRLITECLQQTMPPSVDYTKGIHIESLVTASSEALSPLLSHALSARGSRPYTRLITECLQQTMPPSVDYTYHTGLRTRPDLALNQIKDTVIQVFKSHGATEFSPPLLMPRARAWDQCPNAVKVMTAFGTVCHLPHDLRLPFAR